MSKTILKFVVFLICMFLVIFHLKGLLSVEMRYILLNFVGKFVPGVNILATGYTIKQVIAVGIGAYQTYNGSIPVVNQPFSETIIKTVLQTAMSSGVGVGLHTVFRKSKI